MPKRPTRVSRGTSVTVSTLTRLYVPRASIFLFAFLLQCIILQLGALSFGHSPHYSSQKYPRTDGGVGD